MRYKWGNPDHTSLTAVSPNGVVRVVSDEAERRSALMSGDISPWFDRSEMVCSPRQARMAMMQTAHGDLTLLQAVEAAIYGSGDASLIIAWDFATEWVRDDPKISQIGQALGLSSEELDALFVKAMAL